MATNGEWTRRQFLGGAAGASLTWAGAGPRALGATQPTGGLRGRYVTHVSVVRVNQIEVTPNRSIGEDEVSDNRPERIRSRREAFARGCPGGQMTWAISWLALIDDRQQYKEARKLLAFYHDQYGDEITFIPGGYFAPMFDTREHNRETIRKALKMVSDMVGNGYRPECRWQGTWTRRIRGTWQRKKEFMCARGRSGASMESTMETGTAGSATPTTRAGSTI